MLPISKILAPVDFSDRCLGMMPFIKLLAAKYDAKVTLLHVADPFIIVPATAISGPAMIPVPQSSLEDARKRLETFGTGELQGVAVERSAYEGEPIEQIVEIAKSGKVDLVALPTHGYGALRQFLLGSVTAKVLHDVACPVLTGVHQEEQPPRSAPKFSNIFCAVDLSPRSNEVLAYALRLATDFKAKLSIVHTIAPLDPEVAVLLSSEQTLQLGQLAREKLENLRSAVGAEDAPSYVEEGEVAETVRSVAKQNGADLLVIGRCPQDGSPGRLTTNSYAIIRRAPCPVISV